jgi:hypothetical protein
MNPEIFNLLRKEYLPKDNDTNGQGCVEYYTYLNFLDTYKTTSVDEKWRNDLAKSSRAVDRFIDGKTDTIPYEDAKTVFYHDSKNRRFLSRARFDQQIINSNDDMYLAFFDAVGLNILNRIAMERASKNLIEIFYAGINEESIASANRLIPDVLRQVDIYMNNYNNMLRDAIIKKLGISDEELLGNLQGDETKFAIKKEYTQRIGINDGLQFADFIDEVKKEVEEQMVLYGIQLKFRTAAADINYSGTFLSGLENLDNAKNAAIYIESLKSADQAMIKAKENESKTIERKTRFAKPKIDPSTNLDTTSQTYRNAIKMDSFDNLHSVIDA